MTPPRLIRTHFLVSAAGLAALICLSLSLLPAGPACSITRDDVNEARSRAREIEGTVDTTNVHHGAMGREAEKSFKVFKERRLKDIDEFRARMRYDGEKVTIALTAPNPDSGAASGGGLAPDERVYVFISSSVPRATLSAYARSLDRLKDPRVAMVMRGCVGGCSKIMPTVGFLREVLMPSEEEQYAVDVLIDPMLFRFYTIRSVPTIVYARNVSPDLPEASEGSEENMKTKPVSYAIRGDVSLAYALDTINREAGSRGLARLVNLLQRLDDR